MGGGEGRLGTFSSAWLVLERGVSLSFERNCWRRRDDLSTGTAGFYVSWAVCPCLRLVDPCFIVVSAF